MGSMSIWHWLIVLVIIMLVFGTKKLRNIGTDLGGAVKGFKKAMDEGDEKESHQLNAPDQKDADFDSTPSKTGTKSNV